jgi:hypothetical protein
MPKPIISHHDGICSRCQKPYQSGDKVTYSLKAAKMERYHWPNCIHSISSNVPVSSGTSTLNVAPTTVPTVYKPVYPKLNPTLPKLKNNAQWYDILPHLFEAGLTRVLLVGPPGTGKSKTASDGFNLRVTCHPDAGQEEMAGTFIQKNSETIFVDGAATTACRVGSRLILDEIDHCSPETKSLLYGFLDDEPGIRLPTGEFVVATSGYQVVCTSNASPAEIEEAVFDRIEAVLIADTPHPKALASTTVKLQEIDSVKADKVKSVINNYYNNSIVKTTWEFYGKPTLRRMRNFSLLLAYGMPEDIAAKTVFGKGASEVLSCMTTANV